jgi:predicted nucleic acid-binding protein
MSSFVIDASVAVKWLHLFQSEPLVDRAMSYLNLWKVRKIEFLVPDLFWVEAAGVLWKAQRRKLAGSLEAQAALETLLDYNLPTIPATQIVQKALDIAMLHNRSIYDSSYIALAVSSGSQLLTADEKLVNAVAKQLPVKWLGTP